MQKRNIIFLVIDSLSYKILESYPFPEELFINSFIKPNSTVYNGVYTQGPYTEASMNGLAYGQRGLDCGSFMFSHSKFNHSFLDNIKKDYQTFCSGMSCRLFVDHCKTSFDSFQYHFYTPTVLPTLQWNRVNHFCKLSKKRPLSNMEINCVNEMIGYALHDASSFLLNCLNNGYETYHSKSYTKENDIKNKLTQINELQILYKNNNEKFIKSVLDKEIDFAKLDFNYYVPYEDPKKIEEIFDNYRPKLIKEARKHFKPNPANICTLIKNLKKSNLFRTGNPIINFVKFISSATRRRKWISRTYGGLLVPNNNKKRAVSFSRNIDSIKCFIESSKKCDKPFFVYCQPDDFHPTSIFWTYDCPKTEVLEEELADALALAKRIKSKNCNIFDFLSIAYIDKKIKKLFDYLIESNVLNNTDVLITADHGSWNFQDAIRIDDCLIMTEERMHIPCFYFRYGQKQTTDSNLHNSYSISNTILKKLGYKTDKYFYGRSFDEDINNQYLISENLGFGCPDIYNTSINYVVHNKKYKLNILVNIDEEIAFKHCVSFYDLQKDPLEQENDIKKVDMHILEDMLSVAKKRHTEIKSNTKETDYYCR